MKRLRIIARAAATGCLILTAPATMAQDQTHVPGQINGYFTPVTFVDHPDCDGPGESAFSVTTVAEDLRFRLRAKGWENSFELGGREWFGPDAADTCYVTQGRGADRIRSEVPFSAQSVITPSICEIEEIRGAEGRVRVQIPCGDRAVNAAQAAALEGQTMRLDLSVNVTACQSVMHFNIIDGNWAAELTVGDTVAQYDGVIGLMPGDAPVRFFSAEKPTADLASVLYGGEGDSPSYFFIGLGGIPVDLPQTVGQPVFLTSHFIMFPTVDGMLACPTGDCDIPDFLNVYGN